jgi:hypothetical protein
MADGVNPTRLSHMGILHNISNETVTRFENDPKGDSQKKGGNVLPITPQQ